MEELPNETIEKFKKRIERENKNNLSNRRSFSKRLKKDIAEFSFSSQLSCKEIVDHLRLSNSSIEKWRSNFRIKDESPQFKKIEVIAKTSTKTYKKLNNDKLMKAIMLNQIVLISLLALLITENLLFRLSF